MLIASGGLRRSVSRRRGEPRLVLRFAVITAISLGAAAAALILLTRHLYTVEAERAAAHHAQYVSQSVLGHELAAVDFRRPSTGARRSELDRVLSEKVLLEGTLGVALVRPDGTIVHASDHASIGRPAPRPDRVRDALAGTITSATSFAEVGSSGPVKSLESYVPVVAGGQTAGVAVITQDYAPIAAAARAAFLPVTGIAEGVVVVLFVFLVPMLARAARRLQAPARRDRAARLPGRPHRAAEPEGVPRGGTSRDRRRARGAGRRDPRRPRSLQGGERHARPRRGGRAPARALHASPRGRPGWGDPRAPWWRRVRHGDPRKL